MKAWIGTGLALACAALGASGGDARLEEAKKLAKSGDVAGAAELVLEHLKRTEGDAEGHEWAGRWLLELGRTDEAAHQIATAMEVLEVQGKGRDAGKLNSLLAKADPLSGRRASFLEGAAKDLLRAAEKLAEAEQGERARVILERIAPIARGKDRTQVEGLLDEMAKSSKAVDLDEAAGDEEDAGERATVELECAHYEIVADLEPEVVQLVADTMDDIYGSYVQIYFDGQAKKASLPKATIRIHPTWDSMAGDYPGSASPGLGGWWSPGENKVTCYDTRDRTGSLDEMLDTLFHEASHQFMTMLAGGSSVPSWLNEGTSCFFEGAVAMADHRVLWPDAARSRLQALSAMLQQQSGAPRLADVVGYEGAGSYDGSYYPYGWGLVYFLQQWEDPTTLEYSYRPLYARYRDLVIQKGGSREHFDEVFLGKASPLGHQSFEDFERDWRTWILETIAPLQMGKLETIREKRWQAAQRYLAAAAEAAGTKKAKVGEQELLERAMGQIEMLQRLAPPKGELARDLLLAQVDVFQRLGRKRAEAMTIERLLDLTDAGDFSLEEARYQELEARLSKLDSGNWALRGALSKAKSLEGRALALVEEYQKKGESALLRSATFAGAAANALGSEGRLAEVARELRGEARARGLLLGRVLEVRGATGQWTSLFVAEPKEFRVASGRIEISSLYPVALLAPEGEVQGEYELRGRFLHQDSPALGAAYGWIVGGSLDAGAAAVGISPEDGIAIWEIRRRAGAARPKRVRSIAIEPPLAADEDPLFCVRVASDGRLEIRVGERPPVEGRLPLDLPPRRSYGLFNRDGKLVVEEPVVELYP